jgi:MoxR-like ATPase
MDQPQPLDSRDGRVYVVADQDPLLLAVEVALTTGRPLLLRGEPGTGKSSLAAWVARRRRWRYYEHVVTSRTDATDLLWTFDPVRKLADAERAGRQTGSIELDDHDYVEPGALWWAFEPATARRRGGDRDPRRPVVEPYAEVNRRRSPDHAVVLVDEIDKADPDVPNALLVPLGSGEFNVVETGTVVRRKNTVLVVVTTNEERDLPPAFVRRCVVHRLDLPDETEEQRRTLVLRLVSIARKHVRTRLDRSLTTDEARTVTAVATKVIELRREAVSRGVRPPGIAEFLDTVWACLEHRIVVGDPRWEQLSRMTLAKDDRWR